MGKRLHITMLTPYSLAMLAGKPRVKKKTKKTVVTHQKKERQTAAKRDTVSIPILEQ